MRQIKPLILLAHYCCATTPSAVLRRSRRSGGLSWSRCGFAIYIDVRGDPEKPRHVWMADKGNPSTFQSAMAPLDVQGTERLHTSFGPAEYTDEYTTPHGKFTTHTTLEPQMFAGTDVTADNPALMGRIVRLLRESAAFTEDIERSGG